MAKRVTDEQILKRIDELLEAGIVSMSKIAKRLNKGKLVNGDRLRWTGKGVTKFIIEHRGAIPQGKRALVKKALQEQQAIKRVSEKQELLRKKYPTHTMLRMEEASQLILELRSQNKSYKEIKKYLTDHQYIHENWRGGTDKWSESSIRHMLVRHPVKLKSTKKEQRKLAVKSGSGVSTVTISFTDTTNGRKILGTARKINDTWANVNFSYVGPMDRQIYDFLASLGMMPNPEKG